MAFQLGNWGEILMLSRGTWSWGHSCVKSLPSANAAQRRHVLPYLMGTTCTYSKAGLGCLPGAEKWLVLMCSGPWAPSPSRNYISFWHRSPSKVTKTLFPGFNPKSCKTYPAWPLCKGRSSEISTHSPGFSFHVATAYATAACVPLLFGKPFASQADTANISHAGRAGKVVSFNC